MRAARRLCLRQKESSIVVSPTRRRWSRQFKTHSHAYAMESKTAVASPTCRTKHFGEKHGHTVLPPRAVHDRRITDIGRSRRRPIEILNSQPTQCIQHPRLNLDAGHRLTSRRPARPIGLSSERLPIYDNAVSRRPLLVDVNTRSLHRGRRGETMLRDTPRPRRHTRKGGLAMERQPAMEFQDRGSAYLDRVLADPERAERVTQIRQQMLADDCADRADQQAIQD